MHTKGPWKAVYRQLSQTEGEWSVAHHAENASGGEFCTITQLHWTKEAQAIAESNARLIAEAPAMLDALNDIIVDHDERRALYPLNENQEHRVVVMEAARAILRRIDQIERSEES